MIAYQQDTGVMGLQWATRAKAMDDPAKSRVVGKIDWVRAAARSCAHLRRRLCDLRLQQAGPRHAVPHHRHLGQPGEHARRRVAADPAAQVADATIRNCAKANRFYPAALASYETGTPAPSLPEFYAVGEFITRRILQAVTGEMAVKAGAGRGGDGDHGLPQGSRLLQVTSARRRRGAFPDPTVAGGCSWCRARSCSPRSCCTRWATRSG